MLQVIVAFSQTAISPVEWPMASGSERIAIQLLILVHRVSVFFHVLSQTLREF